VAIPISILTGRWRHKNSSAPAPASSPFLTRPEETHRGLPEPQNHGLPCTSQMAPHAIGRVAGPICFHSAFCVDHKAIDHPPVTDKVLPWTLSHTAVPLQQSNFRSPGQTARITHDHSRRAYEVSEGGDTLADARPRYQRKVQAKISAYCVGTGKMGPL